MLKNILEANNLHFDDKFYADCEVFVSLLQQWGKVHNLSGRLTKEDIYENILDSLYPLSFIDNYDYNQKRSYRSYTCRVFVSLYRNCTASGSKTAEW